MLCLLLKRFHCGGKQNKTVLTVLLFSVEVLMHEEDRARGTLAFPIVLLQSKL